MAEPEAAIKTNALGMIYNPGLFQRRKIGIQNLTINVQRGCIYGFLGQNGAGKTTTIKILVGLQFATSGDASILGQSVREAEARRRVGFMPENPYFYEYLTSEETLEFYGKLSGLDRATRKKRTDELLSTFSLEHARHVPMRNFSKGMRQRLGLAQAIMHKPPVVILDEPMSGLDPLGRRDVRNVILALRDAGQTVFFSSHILNDVEEICDQVCVINLGKKVVEGPLSSLLTGRVLEVKLSFKGIAANGAAGVAELATRTWHDGQLYHVIVDSEEKGLRVKSILEAAGGTLRSMIPHTESLEEYFVRVTDQKKAEAHA